MADPFKILSAGDSVKAGDGPFNSTWHNAVSDATRASLRDAVPSTAPIRPIEVPRDGEIWIANCSEANVDQFTAIGLGQLAIPPDDAGDFRERLCFLSAPLAAGQPFGIVQDAIGPGELYVCKTASGPGGQPPRSGWIRVKGDAAAWSSATTYAIGQQVTYDGDTWIAKAASTNQAPASGSYWQISGAHRGIWDRDEAYSPSDVVLLPQLGRIHIAGVSRAYLNIRNAEHAYAGIEAGELVSQRAPGPLAILWRGGIGSNWAVVRFCCDETLTTPDVTGTGALDLGALVPAATCSYLYTPGGAPEFGAVTVAGTGTYTPPAFTGSGALALGAAESAGVSLAYDVPPSGRLNLGALTADGEGEVTTPPRGRSRLRLGAFEAAGTGAVTFPAFTGSGAMTLGAVFVEHAHAHINRVVAINGDTTEKQLLTVGTAGTDFAIDDSTPGTHKFNLPDASRTARGAINTGTQTIGGHKTFYDDFTAGYISAWSAYALDINATTGVHNVNGTLNLVYPNSQMLIEGPPSSVYGAYSERGVHTANNFSSTATDDAAVGTWLALESEVVTAGGPAGGGVLYCDSGVISADLTPRFGIKTVRSSVEARFHGQWGTDSVGNVISGGIVTTIGSSALGTSRGGTGIDSSGVTDGQLLIGKTSDHSLNLATLTAGSGITITNGAGSITIAATGGGGGISGTGTDNHVVRWDGTSAVQDSGIIIDDTDNITGVTSIDLDYAGLKLQDTGGQHMVIHPVCNTGTFAGDRVLQIGMPDANTTLTLGGDLTTSGAFTTTLTVTANTNVTLPTSGVLINDFRLDRIGPWVIQNLNLEVSASAGALTIAVKTYGGTNPSSTDYCLIPFRGTSIYDGYSKPRKITSAMSLTIPSGATLGTASGVPCRVWIGAVDSLVDAIPETGTVQLFAVNCYDGASTIYPLRDDELNNPTAVGTGSDSAGAMYSTSTVSGVARAIRILGYLEWPSGVSTAGTWTWTSSERLQLYHPGVPLPGDRIQVVVSTDAAGSNGTTAIPADDTIPQNTEGDQIQTVSITPKSAANMLRVTGFAFLSTNTSNNTVGYCLFRDSGADAIASTWMNTSNEQNSQHEVLIFPGQISNTTSSTTYKTRAGGYTGTTYFNRHGGSRYYGGTMLSHLIAEEVMT